MDQVRACTTQFWPLCFAVGNAESYDVVQKLLVDTLRLWEIHSKIPISQINSGFAASFQKVFKEVLPSARFLGDFPHFLRNIRDRAIAMDVKKRIQRCAACVL